MTGLPSPLDRPLLTVDELLEADVLPLGRSAIYAAAKAGQIVGARYIGRRLMFATAELRRWAGLETTNGTHNGDGNGASP